jgi:hypothetical protein
VEAADWYEISVSALFPQIQHADDSPWEHLHLHGGLETGQDDNDFEQITVLGSTSTMLLKLWKRTAISITIIEVGFRLFVERLDSFLYASSSCPPLHSTGELRFGVHGESRSSLQDWPGGLVNRGFELHRLGI